MRIDRVGVIGMGVIGLSWSALLLTKGKEVYSYDVQADYQSTAKERIAQMLKSLGADFSDFEDQLFFVDSLAELTQKVDFIQENGPENLELKQDLFKELETTAPQDLIISSSSSSLPATSISAKMEHPERVIVGHPFNPPHLIPLVEVSPGEKTTEAVTERTMNFYTSIDKAPVRIQKEIPGFVANRLQMAILQEAMYVVKEGIVNVNDLDTIVEESLGIRWASGGPFLSFHLGGGPKGLEGFLAHFVSLINNSFETSGRVTLDEEMSQFFIDQTNQMYGLDLAELEKERDTKQKAIIKATDLD